MVPVADTKPPVSRLPAVVLPVTLALDPVIMPPTVDTAVTAPVTLTLLPVITPPTVLAAVTVPVTLRLVPVAAPILGVVS